MEPRRGGGTIPTSIGLDVLRRADTSPRQPQRGGPAFWLVGLATAAAAFWISGGHMLVDLPGLFASGSGPGLRIAALQSRVEPGPQPVLHIEADLVNDGPHALPLPPIGIDVLDREGRTQRYLLGTSGGTLEAGESFGFSSRLIAPKSGVEKVSLSFDGEDR